MMWMGFYESSLRIAMRLIGLRASGDRRGRRRFLEMKGWRQESLNRAGQRMVLLVSQDPKAGLDRLECQDPRR